VEPAGPRDRGGVARRSRSTRWSGSTPTRPMWESYVAKWEAKWGAKPAREGHRHAPDRVVDDRPTVGREDRGAEDVQGRGLDRRSPTTAAYLTSHMLNARMVPKANGIDIARSTPTPTDKIDAAIAAVLAYQARLDAIARGALKKPKKKRGAPDPLTSEEGGPSGDRHRDSGLPGWWLDVLAEQLHDRKHGRRGRRTWTRTGVASSRVRPPLTPPRGLPARRPAAAARHPRRLGRAVPAVRADGPPEHRRPDRLLSPAQPDGDPGLPHLGGRRRARRRRGPQADAAPTSSSSRPARSTSSCSASATATRSSPRPTPTRDYSLITAESPMQCITAHDAATGETLAGLKLFRDDWDTTDWAYLFLPGELWVAALDGGTSIAATARTGSATSGTGTRTSSTTSPTTRSPWSGSATVRASASSSGTSTPSTGSTTSSSTSGGSARSRPSGSAPQAPDEDDDELEDEPRQPPTWRR
jgi:hypothetical protein